MLSDTRSILRASRAGTIVSVPRGAWSVSTTSKTRERTGIVQRLEARSKAKKKQHRSAKSQKVGEFRRTESQKLTRWVENRFFSLVSQFLLKR
jgi:hypothetical protein